MDMTAEAARWYDNPRLGGGGGGGSPNTVGLGNGGAGHPNLNAGGVDPSDMGAFYALENGASRRYYSTGHYSPHGKWCTTILIQDLNWESVKRGLG